MRCAAIKNLLMGAGLGAPLAITGCGSPFASIGPPPPPTTVTVTPLTPTLLRGETQQFAANVSGPSDKTVTRSVDRNFGSIDQTGLYTAVRRLLECLMQYLGFWPALLISGRFV
jgi:hypothetical protein